MTDRERILEKIDFFCDADRRGMATVDELRANAPTLGECMEACMGETYEVSGCGFVAILLSAFTLGYAVGESISQWTMAIRGLM